MLASRTEAPLHLPADARELSLAAAFTFCAREFDNGRGVFWAHSHTAGMVLYNPDVPGTGVGGSDASEATEDTRVLA